ncbi:hypothetical protein PROAA_2550001 [Candidatus Propionivibrio aalborgensis]|uniref:Uncharacterized protein n=1 Tax=Candidatus Propionivibrio aalborgensis TaxID=1860101 RepID=A0A1A8XVQ5_9RHOO|nr:hypothetical protein PROAA_2550001 [Candidatus Propionivibrio aalborgensis]
MLAWQNCPSGILSDTKKRRQGMKQLIVNAARLRSALAQRKDTLE